MEAARNIRDAVARVVQLKQQRLANPALDLAVLHIKQLQSRRFAGNYLDLLGNAQYRDAASFFMTELYSDRDFSERDAQFSRIAGAMQRVFPEQVTATAVALAELHALTEDLDHAMGSAWIETDLGDDEAMRYVQAWRMVGREADRERQLNVVIGIGKDLVRLVRTPGLKLLLKMMRKPAAAAGLGSLQAFLEEGFDIFSALTRPPEKAAKFLALIQGREASLISQLFDGEAAACAALLGQMLDVS